eukprot:2308133-Prymnesium_polylepis.1
MAVELSQRERMRDARMMRSSLISRSSRTIRSMRSEEVLSPMAASKTPASIIASTGMIDSRSMTNHVFR